MMIEEIGIEKKSIIESILNLELKLIKAKSPEERDYYQQLFSKQMILLKDYEEYLNDIVEIESKINNEKLT